MGTASQQNMIDRQSAKEISKIRVGIFILALLTILGIESLLEEMSKMEYIGDDVLILVVGVIAVLVFAKWRKSTSFSQLRRVNNIFLVLAILVLAAVAMALTIEAGDASAIGDDAPLIAIGLGVVANRFW